MVNFWLNEPNVLLNKNHILKHKFHIILFITNQCQKIMNTF